MKVKGIAAACLALAVFGLLGTDAVAAVLPPGNSGATQYAESLPGAGGDEATQGGNGGGKPGAKAAPGAEAVSPEAATELEEFGAAGKATLNLAAGTAPKPPKGAHRKHLKSKHAARGHQAAVARSGPAGSGPGGSSGLAAVLEGLTGASSLGGLGSLQLAIILVAVFAAGSYAVTRRRLRAHDRPKA